MPNSREESASHGRRYRCARDLVQPRPQRFSNEWSQELPEAIEFLKVEPLVIGSNRVLLRLLVSDSITEVDAITASVESDKDVSTVRQVWSVSLYSYSLVLIERCDEPLQ